MQQRSLHINYCISVIMFAYSKLIETAKLIWSVYVLRKNETISKYMKYVPINIIIIDLNNKLLNTRVISNVQYTRSETAVFIKIYVCRSKIYRFTCHSRNVRNEK